MVDPRNAYKSMSAHARNAQRTSVRLIFSGIGFSAAYFLDPEHGAYRRQQAIDFIRRTRKSIASTKVAGDDPTFAMTDGLVPEVRMAAPREAEDGLRIAR